LTGRQRECGVLDEPSSAARAGVGCSFSAVRLGVGKTSLLNYLAKHAVGCRVLRTGGVQSEMELAYAGLHQLLAPAMSYLSPLPTPQRDALQTAIGLSAGPPPDRFLVGLAVLGLLSEAAVERPLICGRPALTATAKNTRSPSWPRPSSVTGSATIRVPVHGRESVIALWRGVMRTFAQIKFVTVNQAVDGDIVLAEQVHGLGLPGGPIAPTMNLALYEIRDGKIAAWRDYSNPEYARRLLQG
jgi:limonene-1,2-epoxide hydrolase